MVRPIEGAESSIEPLTHHALELLGLGGADAGCDVVSRAKDAAHGIVESGGRGPRGAAVVWAPQRAGVRGRLQRGLSG